MKKKKSKTSGRSNSPKKKIRGIIIRKATLGDMDILIDHRRRMFSDLHPEIKFKTSNWLHDYKKFAKENMRKDRFAAFIVQTKGGVPVASGAVWVKDVPPRPTTAPFRTKEPYLLSMYTIPEYRGYGFATRIVKEAMKWSKKKGFVRMSLHASKMGRRIYKKLGWTRTWEMRINL